MVMNTPTTEKMPARMQLTHWLLIALLVEGLLILGVLVHLTHMHVNYGIR